VRVLKRRVGVRVLKRGVGVRRTFERGWGEADSSYFGVDSTIISNLEE
jgi:hypothetical protein